MEAVVAHPCVTCFRSWSLNARCRNIAFKPKIHLFLPICHPFPPVSSTVDLLTSPGKEKNGGNVSEKREITERIGVNICHQVEGCLVFLDLKKMAEHTQTCIVVNGECGVWWCVVLWWWDMVTGKWCESDDEEEMMVKGDEGVGV